MTYCIFFDVHCPLCVSYVVKRVSEDQSVAWVVISRSLSLAVPKLGLAAQ